MTGVNWRLKQRRRIEGGVTLALETRRKRHLVRPGLNLSSRRKMEYVVTQFE